MAILAAEVLARMRNRVSGPVERSATGIIAWDKSQLNAAAQAVEDLFEASFRAAAVAAINAATVPLVIPNPIKSEIVRQVLLEKLERDI